MKKIFLFSAFLILGLVGSQTLPNLMEVEMFGQMRSVLNVMLYICLAYIMINVGREFELDKTKLRSYTTDYFIAMATAAAPWLFICVYFMSLLPDGYFGNFDAWKENLLLSRFAAPTSAGILFTMLAGAGLKATWIYKKTQVLAIFDDLDTILLMIPLQIMMIGMKWQLAIIVLVVTVSLYLGWKYLNKLKINQSWNAILGYSFILVVVFQGIYIISKKLYGAESAIHIEVLLPAFVLGMMLSANHNISVKEEKISTSISYLFMLLVGLSMPLFLGIDLSEQSSGNAISAVPPMEWDEIIRHVLVVTLLSNLGKMFPLFFYRDRLLVERLALSIGMFTRGEVGAGIIFIAIGYNLGGPLLIISLLTIVLNLILTGFFVLMVKKLAVEAEKINSKKC